MLDMAGRIDTQRFVESPDDQLRAFAVSLMVDTYSLCESWRDKGIYTPKIEDNLLRDVLDTVNTFKSERIAQMVGELREQLRGADADTQYSLLQQINQYPALGRQLGQARGIVINPRH